MIEALYCQVEVQVPYVGLREVMLTVEPNNYVENGKIKEELLQAEMRSPSGLN
jgi:hypothetical protein